MIRISGRAKWSCPLIHKWFTGDSENDLEINIFLAAVESAVYVDMDVDAGTDADVVFKDPAQYIYNFFCFQLGISGLYTNVDGYVYVVK